MSEASVDSIVLKEWIRRMRAGDNAARDELARSIMSRVEQLARKMLRGFPNVRRLVDTGDVVQNSLIRLLRALQQVEPGSARAFFGLASEQIRRELLDLARHFKSSSHARPPRDAPLSDSAVPDPAATVSAVADLEQWCAFHEAVAQLPTEEREVVGLVFYHGWTQAEVADLFGVTERTVRRWWLSARLKLKEQLGVTPDD